MASGSRLAAVFWLALLFVCNGSTPENVDVESLDSILHSELIETSAGPSSGTSALQMELEGMVDSSGNPVLQGNASDTQAFVPPKAASAADIASVAGEPTPGRVDVATDGPERPAKYYRIDYLSFTDEAHEKTAATLANCQTFCSSDPKCRSFTFVEKAKQCHLSKSHMQYDMEFDFLVKRDDPMGGEAQFKPIGPMKYTADAMSKSAAFPGDTKQDCQTRCATDHDCSSLAYRPRDQLCITSKVSIAYDPEATYFEKQGVSSERRPARRSYSENDATEAQREDAPHSIEMKKEIQEKASLTPEQRRFIALAAKDAGDPREQALQNAILSINVKLRAEEQRKIAAANERAIKAAHAAEGKRAHEATYKNAEKKALKASRNELREVLEGDSKSAEKAAESEAKASARAKENAGKERARLAASASCEASQKNSEAADLENAKLATEKSDQCGRSHDAAQEAATTNDQHESAKAKVQKYINDESTATQDLVYIEYKTHIRNTESRIAKITKELEELATKISQNSEKVKQMKDKEPELDLAVGKAKTKKVKAESELHAAQLAVKSAPGSAAMTLARAVEAGARSDLAKAETVLSDAEIVQKRAQRHLDALEKVHFADAASQQNLQTKLSEEKQTLKENQNQYFSDRSDAQLKLRVAKHELPIAKQNEARLAKTLKEQKAEAAKAAQECQKATVKSVEQAEILKQYQDEMKECSAERVEKAAEKVKAEEDFAAEKDAFELKMAQRGEADFIRLMASTKLEADTATSMQARANAGSKLASFQASKVESQQEISRMIPTAQASRVADAKASTKENTAKSAVAQAEDSVKSDKAVVAKAEAQAEKTSASNPTVVIGKARELLESMRKSVGMAEVQAGEDDTTKQYTTSKSDSQGKHISPSGAQDSNATSVAHKSDAEEAQLLMAQVKKEAKVTMLNSAKKQAESALKKEKDLAADKEHAEVATKAKMQKVKEAMANLKKQEKAKEERAHSIAGQWPFAGAADDIAGDHGSAILEAATWGQDEAYGKCLSLQGAESKANLGVLGFQQGTISMWVLTNEAATQRLLAPERPEVVHSPETVQAAQEATRSAVEGAVINSVKDLVSPTLELLDVGETLGRGAITLQSDGSVSVFNGDSEALLGAPGTVRPGQWVNLAFAFGKDHITMYSNGALQYTVECQHEYMNLPCIIGGGLVGSILNVDFWKRELHRSEVSKLPKPASEADQVKFVAHSAEGQYELAKAREENLAAQEKEQKANMVTAERAVKAQELEKNAEEVRSKNEMKEEKERRDELAAKEKQHEASQKEKQKEAESKERHSKTSEAGQKEDAKAQEADLKARRKEDMEKEEAKQNEEEKRAAEERAEKAKQREQQLQTLKANEASQKQKEQERKQEMSKEIASKKQALEKAKQDEVAKAQVIDQNNKESATKTSATLSDEANQKAALRQSQEAHSKKLMSLNQP